MYASHQGIVVAGNINGIDAKMLRFNSKCIFTTPEIGYVGRKRSSARDLKYSKVGKRKSTGN